MSQIKLLSFKISIICLFFFSIQLDAQNISNDNIKKLIDNNKYLSTIHTGISLFDLDKKQEVLNYNSEKKFIPASVLKLFYTLAAIDINGENYKFITKFYHNGNILEDGTLEGDILIYPSGDPTFGSSRFYKEGLLTILKRIKNELIKNNISCIDGNIIMVLPNQSFPVHGSWSVEDLGNYYGGGSWPLNFNDNEYKLTFSTKYKEGEQTKIKNINPYIPELEIINYVTVGKIGSGDNAYIYGAPYDLKREVKGTLPAGEQYTIRGSIPSPPSSFMKILGNYLTLNNIHYQDIKIYENYYKNKKPIFEIKSPSLLTIVKECNDYSINMYSESISQLLCLKSNHRNEYLTDDEIHSFFSKYNFNIDKINIVDGCGLSPDNRLTPKTMNVYILEIINKIGLEKVIDILPEAGKDGNAKRIKNINNRVWLKSGSINGVLNYSGIIKDKNNKYYIFSIMTNNFLQKDQKFIKKEIFKLIKKMV